MDVSFLNPRDTLERQNEKLLQIVGALMRQVERGGLGSGDAYAQFQRAVLLEEQVRSRTAELEHALEMLNNSNARLAQANRETEAARRDLSNAIETVQEGFALFDRTGLLVMCNSRFGMHMPDLQDHLRPGLPFGDYIARVAHSPYLSLPAGETPQAWQERRLQRHAERHAVFNVALANDCWLQISQHRTADGGTVILQTDVTDIIRLQRQEREKQLDNQSRMARATLDHLNQGICIFDGAGHLAGWNDCLSEMMGLPSRHLRRGIDFSVIWRRLQEDFAFEEDMTMERLTAWVEDGAPRQPLAFKMRTSDDRFIDANAQEMPDHGFVISFTDVTAERRAIIAMAEANEMLEQRVLERTLELEDALESAERANATRSRFVAATSHDLLQPLSAANLFLSSVSDAAGDPTQEVIGKARNALHSVEAILSALLDISKLELGHAAMEVGPVSLRRLLAQLEDQFALQARRKGIRLKVVPSGLTVASDPTYLRRVLQNLIGNAIRYTNRGTVLVGVRRRGAIAAIEVWDTGPGIPEEEQQTIFREFHRLNARASASEGMGLGLAIVERACALLGHPLDVASEVGLYTRFTVGVPVTAAQQADAPAARAFRDRREVARERVALLVENDAEVRRAMCTFLERWNITTLDVGSGEEALELLAETGVEPDLLLVDQQLGDSMSGLEFIAAYEAAHPPRPTRIITADRSHDLRRACRDAGVELMHKPVGASDLEVFLAELQD